MSIFIINNLKISDDKKVMTWNFGNEVKSVDVGTVNQADVNEKGNLIFAIIGENQVSSKLFVFQGTGKLVKEVSSPSGFYFSYMSKHPEFGQCIVCSTDSPIDGWYDWYFSIDLKRGLLVKQGPSY